MNRLRAFLSAAGVALAVFTYLSLPILRRWYGEGVNLVVYAGIAVVAGALTYALLNSGVGEETGKAAGRKAFEEEMEAVEKEEDGDEEEIEQMIEDL